MSRKHNRTRFPSVRSNKLNKAQQRRSQPTPCGLESLERREMFATFQVTNLLDSGTGSLRAAVIQANASAGADTINFATALSGGTISLTTGQLVLNQAVTIDARPLAQDVTINASQLSRIFHIPNETNEDYTFGGLTLTGGQTQTSSAGHGGAIRSRATGLLRLDQCTLTNNQTIGANADGGALSTFGPTVITDSTISNNRTFGFRARGGGVQTSDGKALTITRSTISGNTTANELGFGGGVMSGGTATIDASTISNNTTEGKDAFGGGITTIGNLTITNSTISGNRTKGSGSTGGGISTASQAVLTLTRSTVSGNQTDLTHGAAAHVQGPVVITESTVTANNAPQDGAGCGITQPNFGSADVPITVTNSIVAGNGDSSIDILPSSATTLTVNYSLIGQIVFPDAGGNNIQLDDPQLAPLAFNGGPTKTHRPLPGSPAIDAGDPSISVNFGQFEQRGAPFLRVDDGDGANGPRIDVGAFEWQPLLVNTTADGADGEYSLGNFTLREAIGIANTMEDDARITIGVTGQIVLGGTELAITNDMTIAGLGANDLTISGNNASRVFNVSGGGTVNISGMTIRRGAADAGAAILNNASTLNLDKVHLRDNVATGFGGAIASPGGGEVNIANSAIVFNTAGNEAGAIESQGVAGSPSSVTLSNCTIAHNTANGAGFGAISNVATGGSATLTLRNCTIANNTGANGAGVVNAVNSGDATTQYVGTIFANGGAGNGANVVNFGGTLISHGHNLSTDNTGALTATGDLPNTPAGLDALSAYGGDTPTMRLRLDSAAINAGTFVVGIDTDQRGVERRQGAWYDIGAFEREETPAHVTSMSYEYESRQAITFNFDADARVAYARSSFYIEDLVNGDGLSDLGTFTFNATGTQAVWNVTNLLPDSDYRITDGDVTLDFFVLRGDANHDHVVNFDDYAKIDFGYNGHLTGHSNGDFNYDGQINFDDYAIIDLAFNSQGSGLWSDRPMVGSGPESGKRSRFAVRR